MKKFDFGICYEHAAREIESVCLLKYELEKRGYSVYVYNSNDDKLKSRYNVAHFHVLLVPYAYQNNMISFVLGTAFMCDKIVNLQWEQSFNRKQEDDPEGYKTPGGLCREVVHLAWGESNRRRLSNLSCIDDRKLFVVGNITMDFLRGKLRGFYEDKKSIYRKYDIPSDKKVLLFVSSFKAAGLSKEALEREVEWYGEWRRRQHFIAKDCRDTIIEWIKKALAENEDIYVIYRPHPGENADYLDQMQGNDRFRVIADLSVKQWILVVDKIYMWMSTVAVETFFADKTCGLLAPQELSEELQMHLYDDAEVIKKYDEFYDSLVSEPVFPLNRERIDEYYSITDEYSYIRIVDVCEKVFRDDYYLLPKKELEKLVNERYVLCFSVLQRIKKRIFWTKAIQKVLDWLTKNTNMKLMQSIRESDQKYEEWKKMDCATEERMEEITSKIRLCLEGE